MVARCRMPGGTDWIVDKPAIREGHATQVAIGGRSRRKRRAGGEREKSLSHRHGVLVEAEKGSDCQGGERGGWGAAMRDACFRFSI